MEKQTGKLNIGYLVISLDFEMMWGNLEKYTLDGYGKSNVENVRDVIHRMIALFEKYDVHATFATVGLLMMADKNEALENIPNEPPTYFNDRLSPFSNHFIENIPFEYQYLYFAPDLLEELKKASKIEIGTHTYSHFFCWEKGQTEEQFRSDLEMACKVAKKNGIVNKSIVFPRNNVSSSYLKFCADLGITAYRGNPKKYFRQMAGVSGLFQKVKRILDVYINTANRTTYSPKDVDMNTSPVNLPASRFIRPYNKKLKCFESIRLRRIKNEMKGAARRGEIYHIWWHPHNFGANMKENFIFLENILRCYSDCKEKYGMKSMTMNELYNQLNK